jgi:glycosyltransferase involved in cell wall biosynthesis
LLSDPERCRRFGAAGRARVLAEFSEAHVIAQTLAVYAEMGS